jgi:hypothetical protein
MGDRTLAKYPQLKTSAMLFAPTLEEHYAIFGRFFAPNDKVLDVGCGDGSFAKRIGAVGVDENTDLSTIDFSAFDTLLFSESLGYLSYHEFLYYFQAVRPKKLVFKDFMSLTPQDVPHFNYNFELFHMGVLPFLLKQGYQTNMSLFVPNIERWKMLLSECGLNFYSADGVQNVIATFQRGGNT